MKRLFFAVLVLGLGAAASLAADEGWVSLFNGKDLTGWQGDPKLWSVKDGAITGSTIGNPLKYNKFLLWDGVLDNFELKCKFRMEGGNSGIQYRSKHLKDKGEFVVGGYQADMAVGGNFTGILYEERGRGILAQVGQKIIIDPKGAKYLVGSLGEGGNVLGKKFDIKEWHDYLIIAKGNHLQQFIDGKQTIDVIDHDEGRRALQGILALQLHVGGDMIAEFKDIQLKKLPTGGVHSLQEAPIPADAKKVE
jgi:Domain of Unknown Function (DUF1080)